MINFQQNVDLANYTTFGVKARTKLFVEIESEEMFLELIKTPEWQNNEYMLLGTGANVLFRKDFDGLIVKINIKGKKILDKVDNHVYIETGSGENWDEFVKRSIDQGFAGLENMTAIPSSVGAAAFGNIGAYGIEAKDRIVSVRGINTATGETISLSNSQCLFGYRDSVFKQSRDILITRVVWGLDIYDQNYQLNTKYKDIEQYISDFGKELNPKTLSDIIERIRSSKLPDWKVLGTAGSFFKNPVISREKLGLLKTNFFNLVSFDIPGDGAYVKLSAGQLIELAGFKGYRKGNVGTYEKHALIIVNYGGANGKDIVDLAGEIQGKVQEMFGISLSPEVIYV